MILNAHHIIGMESDCVNVCPHLASVQAGKLHILNKNRHEICQTFYTSRLLTKKILPESA